MAAARPAGDPTMRWNEHALASWDQLKMDEGGHLRRTVAFSILGILLIVAGVFAHQVFLSLALLAAIVVAIEYAMWRRSRPTSRIPDYRPTPTVEIELDDDRH